MKHHNTVLHQLLNFLPRQRFQAVVDRHNGDHRIRSLSCWDQLISLLFCQLSGRQSLRDLVDSFNSKSAHHYHLGSRQIRRSSLADANRDRPVAIFQETFFYLLEKVRDSLPKQDATEMVRLIDATTIDLNLNQFEWAKFRSTKAGIKLHTVYDPHAEVPVFFKMITAKVNARKALSSLPMMPSITYVVDRANNDYGWYYSLTQQGSKFVGRMKSNAVYEVIETRLAEGDGVLADEVIRLTANKAKKDCPIPLRRITFRRAEDQKLLVFISNDLECSAAEIASLYKQRLPLNKWFWAIYWVASDKGGISALRFSKLIGVNWRSAYSMLKKFRNSMGHRDSLYRLTDIIELDEALLVEKNRVSEVEELKVKSQYSLPVKAEIKSQGLLQWKLPVL